MYEYDANSRITSIIRENDDTIYYYTYDDADRLTAEDWKVFRFGDCELDTVSRRFLCDGVEAPLTPKEFRLLAFFAKRAGRALTRDEILRSVWGYGVFVTARSVDRCIATLRNKIEPDPRRPTFIKTIREIGYRFEILE